jgi:AcrR family transcriptional regulator
MEQIVKVKRRKRSQGRPQKGAPAVGQEALIAATRQVLRDKHPSRVTRLDIARAAGVDPGLIRYYFGDKDALITSVVVQASKELHDRQVETFHTPASARERLRMRIVNLLQTLYEDPHLHHLIVNEIIHGTSKKKVRERRHSMVHGSCEDLGKLIDEGVKSGEFRRVDPRHLFLATVGACSFPMGERALFEELMGTPIGQDQLSDYAEFLISLFVGGLSPEVGKVARR